MTAPRPSRIVCDVGGLAPDLGAIDALAQLRLGARREGLELRFQNSSSELRDLLAFCGLSAVIGLDPPDPPRPESA